MRVMVVIPNGLEMQPSPKLLNDGVSAIEAAQYILNTDTVETHKIAEHVYAYTHEQDGTYEYNGRVAYVIKQVFGILTALEGEVCILLEEGAGEEHLLG